MYNLIFRFILYQKKILKNASKFKYLSRGDDVIIAVWVHSHSEMRFE